MLQILKSYTITELKKEISKQNIKGYSKMKKNEVIDLMMQTPEKFSYLEMKTKKERSEKQKANDKKLGEMAKNKNKKTETEPEPKSDLETNPIKEESGDTHTMPGGIEMTGSTHNKDSKPVKKTKSKPKKAKKATTKKESKVKASQKEAFEALDDVKFQLSQLINKYQSATSKKDKSKLELQMEKLENQILQIKLKGSKY